VIVQSIASLLRSSALEPISSYLHTCARLVRSACERALLIKQQCSDTLDHTSIAIECTCKDCYIELLAIDPFFLRSSAPLLAASTDLRQYAFSC
jgi:hypothetical protein